MKLAQVCASAVDESLGWKLTWVSAFAGLALSLRAMVLSRAAETGCRRWLYDRTFPADFAAVTKVDGRMSPTSQPFNAYTLRRHLYFQIAYMRHQTLKP